MRSFFVLITANHQNNIYEGVYMDIIQVTEETMNSLLRQSSDKSHPYYYRFRYSVKKKTIEAVRIRKDTTFTSPCRNNFHIVKSVGNTALGRAIESLELVKRRIGCYDCAQSEL